MQQRQPRLGDVLDDYCPRERRLTNHAVVAMIGDTIRLTRCTTCDAEHDYKEGRLPRPRKKVEPGALALPPVVVPKRVAHDLPESPAKEPTEIHAVAAAAPPSARLIDADRAAEMEVRRALMRGPDLRREEFGVEPRPQEVARPPLAAALHDIPEMPPVDDQAAGPVVEEGPVHRQLIRAQLPRLDNQPPPPRQAPDFTIRQPSGRPNRFRSHSSRNGVGFQGPSFRSNGGSPGGSPGGSRGNGPRHAGQPPPVSRAGTRQGPPRKRSK